MRGARWAVLALLAAVAFIAAILLVQQRAHGLDGCLSLSEARAGGRGYASYRLYQGRKCWFTTKAQHDDIVALRENRYRPRRDREPPKEPPIPLPPPKEEVIKVEVPPQHQFHLDETFNQISVGDGWLPFNSSAESVKPVREDGRQLSSMWMMTIGSAAALAVLFVRLVGFPRRRHRRYVTRMQYGRRFYRFGRNVP